LNKGSLDYFKKSTLRLFGECKMDALEKNAVYFFFLSFSQRCHTVDGRTIFWFHKEFFSEQFLKELISLQCKEYFNNVKRIFCAMYRLQRS